MRLFGVKIEVRPTVVLSGLTAAAVTYALLPKHPRRGMLALVAGLLWYEADITHLVSHIISARLADAPMDRIRFGVMPLTLYDDNDVSPQQHIGRSLGGPIGSAIAMLSWWLIWRALRGKPGSEIALIGLVENTIIALGSWLPLPIVDGGVILKNIGKLD